MKSNLKPLLVWLLVAYALCLIPSSCFDIFKSAAANSTADSSFHLSSDLLEWAAHAFLMAGIAFCLARAFLQSGRSMLFSVLCSLTVVSLIAWSIEGLQALLPESFSRGPSASDVWASLLGGLLGCVSGIIYNRFARGALRAEG